MTYTPDELNRMKRNLGITDEDYLKKPEPRKVAPVNVKPDAILYKSKEGLTSIPDLSEYVSLRWLYLSDNNISKIEGLDNLVNLRRLYLGGNQISKIEGLDNLVNLELLRLDNNKISKVEGLSKLISLTKIIIDGNAINENDPYLSILKTRGVSVYI
jgi:Leucine-rich repeat (LRR) protein